MFFIDSSEFFNMRTRLLCREVTRFNMDSFRVAATTYLELKVLILAEQKILEMRIYFLLDDNH